MGRADLIFTFEIKDGPPPAGGGGKYWGRWGILTHEKAGVSPKPKYQALELLSQLKGERIRVTGEGTWVTGLATKNGSSFQLILTNFDPEEKHSENVPVAFSGLEEGTYTLKKTFLGENPITTTQTANAGSLTTTLFLPPNSVVFLEITKT